MLRHKPAFTYCGLTIVISNPSRFDKVKLLCAGGGRLVEEFLQPEFNRYMCDIRVKEDKTELLEGTKCILLLGEPAMKEWLIIDAKDNTLHEMRGSVLQFRYIPTICSYYPQDAADPKNFEKEFNPQDTSLLDAIDDDDEEGGDEKSRKNKTRRKNFRFWLQQDIKKCKYIIKNGIPPRPIEPKYIIAPNSNELISTLTNTKGAELFIDIETFVPSNDIKCISFSFDKQPNIYSFPIFSHDFSWAYSELPRILRALSISFRDNTVIAHNGSNFDFLVFATKYRIPIGRKVKDTMIMMHRCFSDVEKSLGHCTSLWTFEPFHKDEGECGHYSPDQVFQTLKYCAKDVFTMKLCYYAMLEYAKKIPGLLESFDRANAYIRPYLTCTLQGIAFDDELRKKMIHENDRLCMQYIRMSKILIGENNIKMIAGKSKSSLLNSNKQAVEYFHNLLGYDVVAKGKEKEDGTRGPSLNKSAMYKLRIKYNNPVIDLCIAYREAVRETGYLNFLPWSLNLEKQNIQPSLFE
jgi:hypothetical protein